MTIANLGPPVWLARAEGVAHVFWPERQRGLVSVCGQMKREELPPWSPAPAGRPKCQSCQSRLSHRSRDRRRQRA